MAGKINQRSGNDCWWLLDGSFVNDAMVKNDWFMFANWLIDFNFDRLMARNVIVHGWSNMINNLLIDMYTSIIMNPWYRQVTRPNTITKSFKQLLVDNVGYCWWLLRLWLTRVDDGSGWFILIIIGNYVHAELLVYLGSSTIIRNHQSSTMIGYGHGLHRLGLFSPIVDIPICQWGTRRSMDLMRSHFLKYARHVSLKCSWMFPHDQWWLVIINDGF